jgi:hypothetical protein
MSHAFRCQYFAFFISSCTHWYQNILIYTQKVCDALLPFIGDPNLFPDNLTSPSNNVAHVPTSKSRSRTRQQRITAASTLPFKFKNIPITSKASVVATKQNVSDQVNFLPTRVQRPQNAFLQYQRSLTFNYFLNIHNNGINEYQSIVKL